MDGCGVSDVPSKMVFKNLTAKDKCDRHHISIFKEMVEYWQV
jgi:hypothetical protein